MSSDLIKLYCIKHVSCGPTVHIFGQNTPFTFFGEKNCFKIFKKFIVNFVWVPVSSRRWVYQSTTNEKYQTEKKNNEAKGANMLCRAEGNSLGAFQSEMYKILSYSNINSPYFS